MSHRQFEATQGVGVFLGEVAEADCCSSSAIIGGRKTGKSQTMIETNPILAQIADLSGRVESLRGYL